ncbi:hypothetical protein CLIB1423_09S02608 [[Candida] railenensis]|uniref:Uncharacterized protein n=1 Tax=[Candida] railenensis TaxID=45579 RepID=A0A9P0VXZ5_9ASCO|nr:hypothetical protein CLIB1423_09S02608 [[Candida] railenensis]
MEAASKVATSSQGRLRQQLLNSEQDISNLDESNYMPNQQPRQSHQVPMMGNGMAGGMAAPAGGQVSTHASMSGSGSIQSFQQQQYMQYQQQIQQQQMHQQQVPQQIPQHQQREQYLSNGFDIPMVAPKNNMNSSRKGSLTSQSAVNRLFRRNKPGMSTGPMDFDDNDGADIGDLSTGSVSFEDIRHMRDKGPYGMSAVGKPSDSAPIIPTLGAGNNLMGRSAQNNNIQYRKQMNHQKKLAYSQGARANSMATSYNPMQGQQQPHTYSMQAGNNGRMMSLGGGQPQQGPPRAMSLSANAMLQGGPRAMSMNRPPPQQQQPMPNMNQYPVNQMNGMNGSRQQIPTRNGQLPIGIANGPRANSLQQGNGQFQGQGAGPYQQQNYQQQYARTGSLQNGPIPMNRNVPQNFNNNMNTVGNNVGNSQITPSTSQAFPPVQQQYQNNNIQIPYINVNPQDHVSNDSLMNVVEEEEEPRSLAPPKSTQSTPVINKYVDKSEAVASPRNNIRKSMDLRAAIEQTAANIDEEDDEDVVYKFDNDEESVLSRRPTLNKSNSMRLRKLDLFDNASSEGTPLRTVTSDVKSKVSPSFNITTKGDNRNAVDDPENRESMLFNEEELEYDKGRRLSHRNKLETLGASAAKDNSSNATTLTKDVFVTAPDFNSPVKNFDLISTGKENTESLDDQNTKNQDSEVDIKIRGSPVLNAVKNPAEEDLNTVADSDSTSILSNSRTNSLGSRQLQKHSSIQNLVANTAFSKFRSSSISSENGLPPNVRSASSASHGSTNFMSPSVRSASKFRSESPLPPIPNNEAAENTSFEDNFVNNSDISIQAGQSSKINDKTFSTVETAYDVPGIDERETETTSKTQTAPDPPLEAETLSKKPGRRAPPSSMLLPVEINEEKKSKEQAQVPSQKFSSMLLPLDLDNDRSSPVSLRGDPASDAPGTSSSKFSSSEKTTFDSSKDNINMSETSSVYNSSDLNDTMSLKEDKNVLGSISGSAISSSARESNAALSSSASTTSDVTKTPILEESEAFGSESRKTTPRSFSLKSRNIMNSLKRLPGRRTSQSTLNVDEEIKDASSPNTSKTRNRFSSGSFSSSKKEGQSSPAKPFKFTKEELAIMNCNNELLNELELVTTELASAVQRELSLENRLRGGSSPIRNKSIQLMSPNANGPDDDFGSISQYQQQIAVLQDKVNKERRLRFISEEHALLMENGITPSPIKLNYEKTEIYRQLLLKNDEINQLQDRLEEYERKYENIDGDQSVYGDGNESIMKHDSSSPITKNNTNSNSMLESYNELLRENTDLKFKIIPDLEKKLHQEQSKPAKEHSNNGQKSKRNSHYGISGMSKQLSLSNVSNELRAVDDEEDFYDEEYEFNQGQLEIQKLKNQREELREVISKLSSAQSYESKLSHEKIKALEAKLMDANMINEMLSKRIGGNNGNVTSDEDSDGHYKERPMNNTSASNLILHSKGARLQGFNVVASTNTLFDT